MVFDINDTVRDLLGDMGVGVILDIYTNRHDDDNGITTYVIDFGDDNIFDRFAHEIKMLDS